MTSIKHCTEGPNQASKIINDIYDWKRSIKTHYSEMMSIHRKFSKKSTDELLKLVSDFNVSRHKVYTENNLFLYTRKTE